MRTVLLILLDQYADWEAAPLASVVNQTPEWQVKIITPDGQPVHSLGGFTVIPDGGIPARLPGDCAGIVLIGGMSWRTEAAGAVEMLTCDTVRRGAVLGAICDATVFLGGLGLLNDVPHTGNVLSDLQNYCGRRYSGERFYRHENVVRSGGLVTANGTAAMGFAREMLVALGVMSEEDASRWHRLFSLGLHNARSEAHWWFERMGRAGNAALQK